MPQEGQAQADPSEELARRNGQWQSRTLGAVPAPRELDQGVPAAGAYWASGTLGGADFAAAQHSGYYSGDTDLMP